MSTPSIDPGKSPQGWLQTVVTGLKRIGNWLGGREVYQVDAKPHEGLKQEPGSYRHLPDTDLSTRSTNPVDAHPQVGTTRSITAHLYQVITQIDAIDNPTRRLLEECPFSPSNIRSTISTMDSKKQELVSLKQTLHEEIATLANASPELTLATEQSARISKLLTSLENRQQVLQERLNEHPCSVQNLMESHATHLEAACHSIRLELKKQVVPNRRQMKALLVDLQQEQGDIRNNMKSTQPSEVVRKHQIAELKRMPRQLVQKLRSYGVHTDLNTHKHTLTAMANRKPWPVSTKAIGFHYNGQFREFTQTVTPASQMTLSEQHMPKPIPEAVYPKGIFKEAYQTEGLSSHSTHETKHAVNLNTSVLKSSDGKVMFHAVRHAVHSPYGYSPGDERRKEGALQRAEESAVAALQLHPEKMKKALSGEAVDLVLTSSSLLTPDFFRHAAKSRSSDEYAMLQDQVRAWTMLREQKTLPVRIPGGEIVDVPVNIKVVPFNFGVNKFSVGKTARITGGWGYSDSINQMGLKQLIGPLTRSVTRESSIHGGIVGDFLQKNPGHSDTQIIGELVEQIREINQSKGYRSSKGGAAKMAARVMVLTHLIDGTPLVNCKSAKDRTALAVADAERLMTQIRVTGHVPSHQTMSAEDKRLFKEFASQGNHFKIQNDNSGAPGFKIDNEVMVSYVDTPEEAAYLQGLSSAVLS